MESFKISFTPETNDNINNIENYDMSGRNICNKSFQNSESFHQNI
jgi:hypothetical protein